MRVLKVRVVDEASTRADTAGDGHVPCPSTTGAKMCAALAGHNSRLSAMTNDGECGALEKCCRVTPRARPPACDLAHWRLDTPNQLSVTASTVKLAEIERRVRERTRRRSR